MTEAMTASFWRSCSDKTRVVLLPLSKAGASTDTCTEEKEGSREDSLSALESREAAFLLFSKAPG